MRVAAEAANFEIAVAGIERVAECRRWLRGAMQSKHALVPGLASELVRFLAGRRARCSEARTELPKIRARELVPMRADNAPGRGEPTSHYTL